MLRDTGGSVVCESVIRCEEWVPLAAAETCARGFEYKGRLGYGF